MLEEVLNKAKKLDSTDDRSWTEGSTESTPSCPALAENLV